jgi:hypothetical protein
MRKLTIKDINKIRECTEKKESYILLGGNEAFKCMPAISFSPDITSENALRFLASGKIGSVTTKIAVTRWLRWQNLTWWQRLWLRLKRRYDVRGTQ